jgi:hypothetical protein
MSVRVPIVVLPVPMVVVPVMPLAVKLTDQGTDQGRRHVAVVVVWLVQLVVFGCHG